MVGVIIAFRHGLGLHNLSNRASWHGDWAEHLRLRELLNHNPYNSPLAEEGIAQARALRPYLVRLLALPWMGPAMGYVSPQPRAIETAREVSLRIPWEVDHRIRERYWGKAEQEVHTAESHPRILALMEAGRVDPYLTPPGGESVAERYAEALEFLDEKDAQYDGETLCLSSHGEFIKIAALAIERRPLTDWPKFQFETPNCFTYAYSRINPTTGKMTDRFGWKLSFCTSVRTPDLAWRPI